MEINITVTGKRRSCKSKLTYLVKEFLKKEGFSVNFIGDDGDFDEPSFDSKCEEYMNVISDLKKEIKVNVMCGTV